MHKNILFVLVGLLAIGLGVAIKLKLHDGQAQVVENPMTENWNRVQPIVTPNGPKTYKEALEAATKDNKPILLFFSSKTCKPCQKMKVELTQAISSLSTKLIWYEVDVDVEKDLVKKYGVTATPTYLVINGHEQILKTGVGYKDSTTFGEWLSLPYETPHDVQPQPQPEPKQEPKSKPEPKRKIFPQHN